MHGIILLSPWQVFAAVCLIVAVGILSVVLQLELERTLAVAASRMICQLLLIGFILQWVFQAKRWYMVVGILTIMTLIAGFTAVRRAHRRYAGLWLDTLLSIWVSSWVIGGFGIAVVLRGGRVWYEPQYTIPLMGMVLGNSLNGIALGLNAFLDALATRRQSVEALLALGATRWEAARQPVRQAVRMGLIPIVNAMMIAGVVSLPGLMTGQLLSGVAPIEAAKYQIVIMALIASATAFGTFGVIAFCFFRFFSREHCFLYDRLKSAS